MYHIGQLGGLGKVLEGVHGKRYGYWFGHFNQHMVGVLLVVKVFFESDLSGSQVALHGEGDGFFGDGDGASVA